MGIWLNVVFSKDASKGLIASEVQNQTLIPVLLTSLLLQRKKDQKSQFRCSLEPGVQLNIQIKDQKPNNY